MTQVHFVHLPATPHYRRTCPLPAAQHFSPRQFGWTLRTGFTRAARTLVVHSPGQLVPWLPTPSFTVADGLTTLPAQRYIAAPPHALVAFAPRWDAA